MRILSLLIVLVLATPLAVPAMVPVSIFETLMPGMNRTDVMARVGAADEKEGVHPAWLLTESADFHRGVMEFSGDTLEVLTVVYKPGRITANELVRNFATRGMRPIQRPAGGAVYNERNLQTGRPEVRLVIPSPDDRLAGPRLSVMSLETWQKRQRASQRRQEPLTIRFQRVSFGMPRSLVQKMLGAPSETDGSTDVWNLPDSRELLYGLVEYTEENVSMIGTAHRPGRGAISGLAANLHAAGLTSIGRDANQFAFLKAATAEASEEIYLLQPPEDPRTSGTIQLRMTREYFDNMDEEPAE